MLTQSSSVNDGNGRLGGKTRGILTRLLDLFSNVWLGVTLLTLLFFYCSIGSAVASVRQHPYLELTEFEWFHWWPFNLLVLLVTANLTIVTIRRIPLRWVNAGVWTIHAGVIILILGSYEYFTTKLEGDTPVFRRRVNIEVPGSLSPETLVVLPGSRKTVSGSDGPWLFQIQSTNTHWPILSDEDKGKEAYAVNVHVTPPAGQPFVRQLLAGYPQYTEDILPGRGRAINALGRKLVDESLHLALDHEPQDKFYLMQSWALYYRRMGEKEWIETPLPGVPRYNDRIGSREQVFMDPMYQVPLRPIDLPVQAQGEFSAASPRITGYLRYAETRRRWFDGADRLNPVVRLSVLSGNRVIQTHELAAFDRQQNSIENGAVEFIWLDDSAKLDEFPTDSRATLTVVVPEKAVRFTVPLTAENIVGRTGNFRPIEKTDFTYRIVNVADNLVMPSGGTVSVAMVEIQSPETRFTRMVANRPEATQDLHGDDFDPHNPSSRRIALDPRIQMTYQPATAPVTVAAHPGGLHVIVNGPAGRMLSKPLAVSESVEVVPGLGLRADSYWPRAVAETKPYIVPPSARNRNVGEGLAKIRLELQTATGVDARWLSFHSYPISSAEYAYAGRFPYIPERFVLADGTRIEVLFSRRSYPLPNAIAMEDFELDTHLGGFTGSALTIRNYVSRLRFWDGTRWTDPVPISVNNPTEYGGFWYFQSTWDRPPSEDSTAGMNYTGLGVGNRHGVYVQLLGCCLTVAGMIFAFYYKPMIQRRRTERAAEKTIRQGESPLEWEEALEPLTTGPMQSTAEATRQPVGEATQ